MLNNTTNEDKMKNINSDEMNAIFETYKLGQKWILRTIYPDNSYRESTYQAKAEAIESKKNCEELQRNCQEAYHE